MTTSFHEVRLPLRVALGTTGGPRRRTDIVSLSNGRESRNARWKASRRYYDAGSGIRALADLYAVLAFFEARSGQLYGFRFRDPIDFKSCPPDETPAATDQRVGTGDGATAAFQLIKTYADAGGSYERIIAKPVEGSVVVAIDGTPAPAGDVSVNGATGLLTFAAEAVPPAGTAVTAGYEFDVPVRFDIDRLDLDLAAFNAGRIPAIPLVEIMP